MNKVKKIFSSILVVFAIVVMLNATYASDNVSITASKRIAEVGEQVEIVLTINGSKWELILTGAIKGEIIGSTETNKDEVITKKYILTCKEQDTYQIILKGNVTRNNKKEVVDEKITVTAQNSWWGTANNFWNGANNNKVATALEFLGPLEGLIKTIGNMVFVAVTVILGVKYIWGGADSKASVKDSMVTLVISALVFYGWNTISALFMNSNRNNLFFITGDVEYTAKTIFFTIMYVCNFLAVIGLVFIGVRYLMAGAEGRSQLKVQSVPVVLGVIMVYATITFLDFIVGIL